MIDINHAVQAFERYVSQFDMNIPSIRLKVVHTYEVMKCTSYLCDCLKLNDEQKNIALLIGLLHDIGRFEQWMKYKSFADYKTCDHALLSSSLLFDHGMIREFVEDSRYDDIIKISIEQHNKYKIDKDIDHNILLFVHLIRDADKLDNFRVKEEESIETLFNVSIDRLEQDYISDKIYNQFMNNQLIYAPDRETYLDMWLSYIAFVFDLHFDESVKYIDQHHYIERSFNRIHPVEKITLMKYNQLKESVLLFIEEKVRYL